MQTATRSVRHAMLHRLHRFQHVLADAAPASGVDSRSRAAAWGRSLPFASQHPRYGREFARALSTQRPNVFQAVER
jgi:hypothetical protein